MTILKTFTVLLLTAALSLSQAEQWNGNLDADSSAAGSTSTETVTPEPNPAMSGSVPLGAFAVPAKPVVSEQAGTLRLFVLLGNGAVNSIVSNSATTPIVEVRNDRNMPVEGAEVVFELPETGPSGYFTGQKRAWIGVTDINGQLTANAITPNQEKGPFQIHVTARYHGSTGKAVISQTNTTKPFSTETKVTNNRARWTKIAIIAAAGGGAAVGIILATRSSGPASVVLQPGTITFGGPK